jgi:tetratricopeptide (TPR) repeat protein
MSDAEEQEELQVGRKLTEDLVDDDTAEKLKKNGTVLGIFLVVVLAAVGYYYYSSNQAEKAEREAAVALSKVLTEYDAGNYSVALDGGVGADGSEVTGLASIAEKYDDVAEGKLAALYAGNAHADGGQYDDAKRFFEMATASDASLVKSGAYAGLALVAENNNDYSTAADNYKNAAENLEEPTLKAKYLYYSALNREEAGNKDEAKKIYESIVDIAESSEFAKQSKAKLASLGTKID